MRQAESSDFKTDLEQYSQQGSQFPLRVGAEYSEQETRTSNNSTSYVQRKCRVIESIPAKQLHPRLTGTAWKVVCDTSVQTANSPFNVTSEKHYLEDFGLNTTDIGVTSKNAANHWKTVLPVPGQQVVMPYTYAGGRATTATYEQFNLSIDRE